MRVGAGAACLDREVDHHDAVLLDDADQQHDADDAVHRQRQPAHHQRQQRAHAGRGQGGNNGEGVDVAFIQHAQHDVDQHQRGQQQPHHVGLAAGELGGLADELRMHLRGHVQPGLGLFDRLDRIGQGVARRDIERHRHRRQLLLVADHQRGAGDLAFGQRGQRNDVARTDRNTGVLRADAGGGGRVGRGHLAEVGGIAAGQRTGPVGGHRQLVHQRGAGAELRRHFQHHAVLVELGEDGGDLALAESVVQGVVDGLHRHAEHAGLVAVDGQLERTALVGQVVVHVGKFRALAQRFGQTGGLQRDLRAVHVRQRVLVLGGGHAGIQGDVLHRLEIQRHPGNARHGLLQARQDLIQPVAVAALLEHDRQLALVERGVHGAGADEGRDTGHCRVAAQGFGHRFGALLHLREGNVLVGLHHAGDQAGVLFGQQALGDHDVQHHGQHQRTGGDRQGQRLVIQHPVQAALVQANGARPHGGLAGGGGTLVRILAFRQRVGLEQVGAHHRGERQRDQHRQRHRDAQHPGEFVEQAAGDTGHQQQRQEHRHQRDGQ